jgi:hypothetical protein
MTAHRVPPNGGWPGSGGVNGDDAAARTAESGLTNILGGSSDHGWAPHFATRPSSYQSPRDCRRRFSKLEGLPALSAAVVSGASDQVGGYVRVRSAALGMV